MNPLRAHESNSSTMGYCKGSTIEAWESCSIVPIFDLEGIAERLERLPRFRSAIFDQLVSKGIAGQELDERVLGFIRGIIISMEEWDHVIPSVVVALRLIMSDKGTAWLNQSNSSDHEMIADSFSSCRHLRRSWKLVESNVSLYQWEKFVFMILRRMHIVPMDHPLMTYSAEQISHLNPSELDAVVDILQLQTASRSPLAIQKLVRDLSFNESSPLLAVLLPLSSSECSKDCTISSLLCYEHSCFPTARLAVNQNGTVILTALYDIDSCDEVSICYVRDGTVEQRDSMLQYRTDGSCICARCIFEFMKSQGESTSSIASTFSKMNLIRLGRYFMSQSEFETAKILYLRALEQFSRNSSDRECMIVADIWHALGAIELSRGKFLKAQYIWDEALSDLWIAGSSHPGLTLQRDKLRCYGYTKKGKNQIALSPQPFPFQWETPAPGCFVTPMLDIGTCDKVVRWAEDLGSWTKHRHYEVPTFDIPVHSVAPLLDWFQNEFMIPLMNPLLAQQFEVANPRGYFYVHDAFCVRYESGAASNHLPIHTDESTHSLVISLNDGFEGGGTFLFDEKITIRPRKGSVLSFRGDQVLHGGEAVCRGIRYILAVFLYYDDGNVEVEAAAKKPKRKSKFKTYLEAKKLKADFSFNFDCGETQSGG